MKDDKDIKLKKLQEAKARREAMQKTLLTNNYQTTRPETDSQRVTELINRIREQQIPQGPEKTEEMKKIMEKTKEGMQRYYLDQWKAITAVQYFYVPNENETYDNFTQCNFLKDGEEDNASDDEFIERPERKNKRRSIVGINEKGLKIKNSIIKIESEEGKDEKSTKNLNSEENKRNLLNSDELINFVSKNSKYVERALSERTCLDLLKRVKEDDEEIEKSEKNEKYFDKKNLIHKVVEFYDENLIYKRTVTNLEWSAKHPEILLASYNKSEEGNLNDPNGLIALWSLGMRKKPEYVFTCQTEITSAIIHKFNPKLVIGATYTGQIYIWDTRGKNTPVQKTPLGAKNHSHPIYCLGITGSSNSHSIVSVSNDGVLCTWSMSNLSKFTKQINLKAKKRKTPTTEFEGSFQYLEEVGAISMATQESETNNVLLGTDDSDIYQVYTHTNSSGNENNDNVHEVYRKHTGPVTGLDLHPGDVYKNANLNHLFLSCSMDWTFNLWSKNIPESPIFSFELNDDYIYDIKWHPTHPALFSTADGSGKLDFWDLNKDYEVPSYSYEVGKEALNKISWSQDGRRLAVAETTGKISVLNFDKRIIDHKAKDAFKLEKVVQIGKNMIKK